MSSMSKVRAVVLASLIGGLVFLLLQMALAPLLASGNAWDHARWTAALVLGPGVVDPAAHAAGAPADAVVVATGLAIHFALALAFGAALLVVVERYIDGVGPALISGALFGFALYILNLGALVTFFPWFAGARTGVGILSHVAFGLVTVKAYLVLQQVAASRRRRRHHHVTARA